MDLIVEKTEVVSFKPFKSIYAISVFQESTLLKTNFIKAFVEGGQNIPNEILEIDPPVHHYFQFIGFSNSGVMV